MTRSLGIALLVALLAGCGSSPRSTYYLLTTDVMQAPDGDSPSLGIGPIGVPEYLNRNGLVYSRQGNQLQVSTTERWAEPLEAGIKRTLAVNLASLLNTQDIRYFPWDPANTPDYGISINLLQLDANDERALLAVEWSIVTPKNGENIAKRISTLHHTLPGGNLDAGQIAPAYSDLLAQLGQLITETIKAHQAATKGD